MVAAKFDFEPSNGTELKLVKGVRYQVTRRVDDNWSVRNLQLSGPQNSALCGCDVACLVVWPSARPSIVLLARPWPRPSQPLRPPGSSFFFGMIALHHKSASEVALGTGTPQLTARPVDCRYSGKDSSGGSGIFPISYVEAVVDLSGELAGRPSKRRRAELSFSYSRQRTEDISAGAAAASRCGRPPQCSRLVSPLSLF